MSTKENNEVVVEKVNTDAKVNADAKCEIKGIKRSAEVSREKLKKLVFFLKKKKKRIRPSFAYTRPFLIPLQSMRSIVFL